ncbi:FAD-dependent oxidoreductase [Kribbella deserti]|uniref:FAD-dependent oxidoreductase n=1 Tax=Kribbella deserti TaxID=1926257 RepID=A0ABV6QTV4_9ACTN
MTVPEQAEVVVVGAGPVGLALGVALRIKGHQVVVLDRQAEGANTSRAAVIHARTLEMLEGLGVTESLVEQGIHAKSFSVRSGRSELLPVEFGDLPTLYPYTLMIPQNLTEQILLDRLTELGGQVHRPYVVTQVVQDDEGATVTLADGQTIRTSYVVAADGMHSVVRDQAGLGFEGEDLELSFALADVRAEGLPLDEVVLFFSSEGILVSAPLPDGSVRLVAQIDPAPEEPDVEFAQRLVDARGPGRGEAVVREVIWGSRFRIHERVASQFRAGRILLAGDAAHTHSPAGGQGMNLGLRDAVALATALSTTLGKGDDAPLDEYAVRARAEARQVVALAHRLTVVGTAKPAVRDLRNLLLRLLAKNPRFGRRLAFQLAGLR